jgi:replication-associated recombination protein RarA
MIDIPQYDPHVPKQVEDIVGNSDLWRQLAEQIGNNHSSHIVLCGPTGCGKSLFFRIVLDVSRYSLLTIDCTANSGLRDLRDTLRGFARGGRSNDGHFRWIVLEHADALTADTQAFLRRMMETTSSTTRIAFECRDAGAIAEPILSRSMLYTANAPNDTDVKYELMRRTDFTLDSQKVDQIVAMSNGNLRHAMLQVLAVRWNPEKWMIEWSEIQDLLKTRPNQCSEEEWIQWSVQTEQYCRNNGIDIRLLLQVGWPKHPDVSYITSQWSRLGGISPRSLFFVCMQKLQPVMV